MKKPDRQIPTYDVNTIHWERTTGTIEASQLGQVEVQWCIEPWNDAADVGFWVWYPGTCVSRLFLLVKAHTNAAGDFTHWDFKTPDGTHMITVFND